MCSLSQYCDALLSETRLSVNVEGAPKSIGKTGSHTTNTRILESPCFFSSFSSAEAPCKQTGQVGETSSSTRTELADPLNASLRTARLESFNRSSGWPAGVVLPP